MKSKIESLTPAHEAKFPEYIDRWAKIGLSMEDVNVDKALSIIKTMYTNVGLPFPKKHEVYGSPFSAITAMKEKYNFKVKLEDFVYAYHDAGWLSFYQFFRNEVDIEVDQRIDPLVELAKECGWCLFFDDLVVITRRIGDGKFDEENRLHCEDGLAIVYEDGDGVACWHGQRIPKEWILDKSTLTPDVLLHWDNVDQRRCACEIVGWANVLKLLDSVVIDKDVDPTIGTLVEVDVPDSGKERFLLALDPNVDKMVGLHVPKEMKTALEANSWTYGIEKFNFKPDFRV